MTWGTHGSQTIGLWYRLSQEVITPTQLLATGTACATIRYSPPLTMEPLPGSDDQWMLSALTELRATTPDGGSVPGPVQEQILRTNGDALAQDIVQSFLFPWEFYVLGQQYLARLQEIQPPASASVEQRMVWAVDVAWWINMMLAATNIYPSWLTPALTSLLDPNWVQGPYVAPERDAELADVVPFSSLGLNSVTDSWPYRVPFARNPGEFNTNGYLRNQGAFSTSEFARVKHFARQQPWRNGVSLQGDSRVQQADPDGRAGVLIAVAQHQFFRPFIDASALNQTKDFFGTINDIKLSATKLARFNKAYTKLLPAWLSVMRVIPYWDLVRAGINAWQRVAINSTTLATREDMTDANARFPMTRQEIGAIKREWEKQRDEQQGLMAVTAAVSTAIAVVASVSGSYPQAQMGAFNAWVAAATFRYGVPRAWERAWEIHPVLMRLYPTFSSCDCLRLEAATGGMPRCAGEPLKTCAAGPSVRNDTGGWMQEHVMQNLSRIERAGGLWLIGGSQTHQIDTAALEALAQPAQPAQPAGASAGPVDATDTTIAWQPSTALGKPKRTGVLLGVGALLIGAAGIVFATKGRR